ncbi:hypothetical protein RB597_007886 [Gaeumannomyces tritici]
MAGDQRSRGEPSEGKSSISRDSESTDSTASLVFEHISDRLEKEKNTSSRGQRQTGGGGGYRDRVSEFDDEDPLNTNGDDLETGPFLAGAGASMSGAVASIRNANMDRGFRRVLLIVGGLLVAAWVGGLIGYVVSKSYKHPSQTEHDPQATAPSRGSGRTITMDQVRAGLWQASSHSIEWIEGPEGQDGLMIETDAAGKDYVVIEDVRAQKPNSHAAAGTGAGAGADVASTRTLMKAGSFDYRGTTYWPSGIKASRDLKKLLLFTDSESNWRHSFTAKYWILDVGSQTAEPLVPEEPDAVVQNAQWSPTSDAVVFTRDNNLYVRRLAERKAKPITTDGGPELFYGVPDWVYEEEVLAGASATWLSEDGKYVAFLRTNETGVPEFPVQYFMSRPSRTKPAAGEETYPEVRQIKYPRAGSHNPVVDLQFYDMQRGDVFSIDITGGFADDDRLVTAVVWAGDRVLIKETNRVSDVMRVVLVDVAKRSGKTVRTVDVGKADGGWFEISHNTRYIPADPAKGRAKDGYVDTVIYNDGDHLAYFSPPESSEPVMLTSGPGWEVVDAPSAVDLANNLVYFVATKEGSTQRHVYSVGLDGKGMKPFTDTSAEGYHDASFSALAGYALLSYQGPKVPWQKVVNTPSNPTKYEATIEDNARLAEYARKHELPILVYGTLNVDGAELNYVERRPPHFSDKKRYPVLFQQYSGPGSQSVSKRFGVDFQSYVAAALGYVVVTVDGRGTGFIGRKNRVLVRKDLGRVEAHDQIAAARHWASLKYVDASRIAIWGWSYGGFMALKTLEQDAGRTFSYGMSVAPVTDWRFYDSIYTERYMLTPQLNPAGYESSAIKNTSALAASKRFLVMHGVADDNVHMQNSLTLLDELDLAGIENYDVHVFPDSDHSIYFHNANRIVYDKLENWLVNAFNGEWLKVNNAKPIEKIPLLEEEKK